MDILTVISLASRLLELAQHASATADDVQKAYTATQNLFSKEPDELTEEDEADAEAVVDALEARGLKPIIRD